MQAARDFVAVVVELTACVQDGHDDFRRRPAFLGVNVDGNATPIVYDGDGFVGMDGDGNFLAMACQRLVDGVVDDFEHHVVQAGAVIGIADVHAWALADRFETL